jgi:hypothetical protein
MGKFKRQKETKKTKKQKKTKNRPGTTAVRICDACKRDGPDDPVTHTKGRHKERGVRMLTPPTTTSSQMFRPPSSSPALESSRDAHRAVLARIRGRPTDEVVSPAEIFICSPSPLPSFWRQRYTVTLDGSRSSRSGLTRAERVNRSRHDKGGLGRNE